MAIEISSSLRPSHATVARQSSGTASEFLPSLGDEGRSRIGEGNGGSTPRIVVKPNEPVLSGLPYTPGPEPSRLPYTPEPEPSGLPYTPEPEPVGLPYTREPEFYGLPYTPEPQLYGLPVEPSSPEDDPNAALAHSFADPQGGLTRMLAERLVSGLDWAALSRAMERKA